MFSLILTVCLFVLPVSAAAQNRELRGRVVDEITRLPVVGAMVRLPDHQRFTLTNQDGIFRITQVPRDARRLIVSQLGYANQEVILNTIDAVILVTLAPKPIELEQLVVHSGRMKRDAQARATRLRTFWEFYDRDKIVQSGFDKPIEFLTEAAHLVIRKCVGLNKPNTLCVSEPHVAVKATHAPSYVGRYPTKTEQMRRAGQARVRGNGSRPPTPYEMAPLATSTRYVPVFLDDKPMMGSIEQLATLRMADIHRVETFGVRGEREIRFYTLDYINLLATGAERPELKVLPVEYFEKTDWKDLFRVDTLRVRR